MDHVKNKTYNKYSIILTLAWYEDYTLINTILVTSEGDMYLNVEGGGGGGGGEGGMCECENRDSRWYIILI